MTTPLLKTYVRSQTERRERQMQTAFPAKVLSWSSGTNTVRLEPQFVETWVTSDGTTHYEDSPDGDSYVDNVPVCYPWHMTWDITVGAFGLVICTKYSLDLWRQQLRRMDPGDLRRFTMSGATFHPVVIGSSPNGSVDFVALKQDVEDISDFLDELKLDFNAHTHKCAAVGADGSNPTAAIVPRTITSTYSVQASTKVKVE